MPGAKVPLAEMPYMQGETEVKFAECALMFAARASHAADVVLASASIQTMNVRSGLFGAASAGPSSSASVSVTSFIAKRRILVLQTGDGIYVVRARVGR